jgi:DNA-binding beta-propeller fold protein YncE
MSRRILVSLAGALLVVLAGRQPTLVPRTHTPGYCPPALTRSPLSETALLAETTLLALEYENGCLEHAEAAPQGWPEWQSATMAGGDVPPTRVVSDPYPTLHSIVVDTAHDRVFMSDPNRHAIWSYPRLAVSKGAEAVTPLTSIRGPSTGMMFIAGVTVDSKAQEMYVVDNDIGDRMMVFPYDADGNVKPKRVLNVPHQAWGLSINHERDEVAITVEAPREIVVYKRTATGSDAPLRIIRGPRTGLGDPHGIFFDGTNNELIVANHGNNGGREPAPGDAGVEDETDKIVGGRFDPPSITVYPGDAKGDVAPIRKIQGAKTGLNWPMALDIDLQHSEIAVANNGDSSIRIFRRTDGGDIAPVRVITGARTGIKGPMGVAFDVKNDEIWVANYGDHTALVFSRTAAGNVAPKRVVRNAPTGSPTVGFGNPGAVAYDSKRDEILVPN